MGRRTARGHWVAAGHSDSCEKVEVIFWLLANNLNHDQFVKVTRMEGFLLFTVEPLSFHFHCIISSKFIWICHSWFCRNDPYHFILPLSKSLEFIHIRMFFLT